MNTFLKMLTSYKHIMDFQRGAEATRLQPVIWHHLLDTVCSNQSRAVVALSQISATSHAYLGSYLSSVPLNSQSALFYSASGKSPRQQRAEARFCCLCIPSVQHTDWHIVGALKLAHFLSFFFCSCKF